MHELSLLAAFYSPPRNFIQRCYMLVASSGARVLFKGGLEHLFDRFMQNGGYGFPRISLLGNSVNRGGSTLILRESSIRECTKISLGKVQGGNAYGPPAPTTQESSREPPPSPGRDGERTA